MTVKRCKFESALTLIEVMVATSVLVITITGALSYQYYAARDTQIARAHIAATRTAQLLLEDWMSTGGSKEYDPSTLGLGFSSAISIPSHFSLGQGGGLGNPIHDAVHSILPLPAATAEMKLSAIWSTTSWTAFICVSVISAPGTPIPLCSPDLITITFIPKSSALLLMSA